MSELFPNGHPEPPVAGDETATLIGSLERQRATFLWKCSGLGADGLNARLEPSTITLGGLLKHLAFVEAQYFNVRLRGADFGAPWDEVDWETDWDWEWHSASDDSPEDLIALWSEAVRNSRTALTEALGDGDMGQAAGWTSPEGHTPSIRRVLVDLIEEYARHVGHADLIRESIDGRVGEDPPEDFYRAT